MHIRPEVAECLGEGPAQLFRLTKHFFDRFFESELVSPNADSRLAVAHILAVLTVPGCLASFWMMGKYAYLAIRGIPIPEHASMVDKSIFVALSMAIMGFICVLEWDLVFPDRKDFLIQGPLPISIRTIFTAKLLALMFFLSLFILAINSCSTLLYTLVVKFERGPLLLLFRNMGSHAAAVSGGSFFVFFLFGSLQGLLTTVLSHRAFQKITRFVQLLLFFVLVLVSFQFPRICVMFKSLWSENHLLLTFFPPAWYLGVYEVLMGKRDPQLIYFATIGFWALVLSMAVFALFFLLGYQRQVKKCLESIEEEPRLACGWLRLLSNFLDGSLVRSPAQQSTFHFAVKTVLRSQRHRLMLSGYLGTGLALVVVEIIALILHSGYQGLFRVNLALLSAPQVLSFLSLVGMRYVFTVPAALEANWIFKLTEGQDKAGWSAGVRKVMWLTVICPLFGAMLPVYAWLWGWKTATAHLCFGLTLSLFLTELLLRGFFKVPFTCSYLPAKANLKSLWAAYVAAFGIYAYTMSELEFWLLKRPLRMIVFYGLALSLIWKLISARKARERKAVQFIYEENPEPVVLTLDLCQ